MNKEVYAFVEDIIEYAPIGNKNELIEYIVNKYQLTRDRKVYYCDYYAVRVSFSSSGSFSNTVLSLSTLQKYDRIPFFVVLVRKNNSNIIYLANSSFISKISHSSKELSLNNIKGSFNGSDIIKEYELIKNSPENFDELFAIHQGLDWMDNLKRLVDSSSSIVPKSQKFQPSAQQKEFIKESVSRACDFIQSENFRVLNEDLNERCYKCRDAILIASHIENINIRGRLIEFLITTDDSQRKTIMSQLREEAQLLPQFETHDELGDYERCFDNGHTYTDIKTKIIYLNSAPKAYNIDKFLEKMANPRSLFFFFLVGISEKGLFNTALCSAYDTNLIKASIPQHHWAGRATRGVIQFKGKILNEILQQDKYQNNIDQSIALNYIESLVAR